MESLEMGFSCGRESESVSFWVSGRLPSCIAGVAFSGSGEGASLSYPDKDEESRVEMDEPLLGDSRGLGESPLPPSVLSPCAGALLSSPTGLFSGPAVPDVGMIIGWIWVWYTKEIDSLSAEIRNESASAGISLLLLSVPLHISMTAPILLRISVPIMPSKLPYSWVVTQNGYFGQHLLLTLNPNSVFPIIGTQVPEVDRMRVVSSLIGWLVLNAVLQIMETLAPVSSKNLPV
jgi:hypothetical protein